MTDNVVQMPPRYDQPGYYALADLPQSDPVHSIAKSTGYWELDQIFKIYPGQFVVVTGIPGHGKSTLMLNIICNLFAESGIKSFLYVPENERHVRERLSLIWGDRQGWEAFSNVGCFIQSAEVETYNAEPKTLQWVLDQAYVAVKEDGVKVILIDPWNELERAKPRDMQLTDYIGQCLMWLKRFCRMFGVTVVVVAHPTKQGVNEGKTPTLTDIEGSMNWYNKCDNGLIVVRESEANVSKVISAKVREIGAGKRGACWFDVDPETGIFKAQYGAVT
jgi:twinkle protein